MNKKEFLSRLEEALLENMDITQAMHHIKYYRDYIESEVAKGRLEEDIVASLQSPRLIAKNIVNNSESASKYDNNIKDYSSRGNSTYSKYNSDSYSKASKQTGGITFSVNGKPISGFWVKLVAILAVIVVLLIVLTVIRILVKFVLPVVLVILFVSFIIKIFKNNGK